MHHNRTPILKLQNLRNPMVFVRRLIIQICLVFISYRLGQSYVRAHTLPIFAAVLVLRRGASSVFWFLSRYFPSQVYIDTISYTYDIKYTIWYRIYATNTLTYLSNMRSSD